MIEILQSMDRIFGLDLTGLPEFSPAVLFLIFVAATFVSEDAACLAAGTLASQGRVSFLVALAACFLGIVIGDIGLYWAGRIFGRRIVETKFMSRFVSAETLSRTSGWFDRKGASAVFVSRFITGLRLPTYIAAGTLRTSFPKFAFYFLLAAAIWTPIVVGVASLSSNILSNNLLFAVAGAFVCVRVIAKLVTWKNRRIAAGRIRRILNWEFWPVQIFYIPVVCYVFLLAIRHRSICVFTCTNPSIHAGGFVGESKNSIYNNLKSCESSSAFTLRHLLLEENQPAEARLKNALGFLKDNGLSFPVVLKPDAGERGKGVQIVRSFERLHEILARINEDYVLQEYFAGDEASIFYYRFPDQPHGKIFSVTEKRFPAVTGDGVSGVQTLILRDRRAATLAHKYFDQNRDRLDNVPAKGEIVQLIDIGTHSRGAIFLDGGWLKTERLEAVIDDISRGIDGFYFGRFDIRAKSFADLQNGEHFKIIELNGVTSESTNIYDPRYSLFEAYGILFRQWRLAFEIGAANRDRGAKPTSPLDLVNLMLGVQIRPDDPPHSPDCSPAVGR